MKIWVWSEVEIYGNMMDIGGDWGGYGGRDRGTDRRGSKVEIWGEVEEGVG